MKAFRIVALLVGIAAFAGGCSGLWRPKGEAAGAASLDNGQVADTAVSTERQIEASCASLEQYGFAVTDFRAIRDEYDMVSVIGEIKNVGPAAVGVELQATLRSPDGRIVAVGHFCPASYMNIIPGESWPFGHSFGRQNEAARAELRIVGTFRTMDILGVASVVP